MLGHIEGDHPHSQKESTMWTTYLLLLDSHDYYGPFESEAWAHDFAKMRGYRSYCFDRPRFMSLVLPVTCSIIDGGWHKANTKESLT